MGRHNPSTSTSHADARRRRAQRDRHESETDSDERFATPVAPAPRRRDNTTPVQFSRTPGRSASKSSQSSLLPALPRLPRGSLSQRDTPSSQKGAGSGPRLRIEDMVNNFIHFAVVMQVKKIPVKKSEIIKHVMNGQTREFKDSIQQIASSLDDVFGLKLIGLRVEPGNESTEVELEDANCFLVVSEFDNSIVNVARRPDYNDEELKVTALRVLLTSMYIANRDVDEDYIWDILQGMGCKNTFCERQENLRKVLKTDAVDPMYFKRMETDTRSADSSSFRYTWGIRAHLECDKYEMLKSIAEIFKKPVKYFTKQYLELLNDDKYKDRIEQESQQATMGEGSRGGRQNNRDEEQIGEETMVNENNESSELEEIIGTQSQRSTRRSTRNNRN